MPAKQRGTVSLKYFIVPTIVIIVTFAIGSVLVARGIRNFYYGILEQQSMQYAENYALQLTKSAEALEIINDLLDDKLLTAMNSVSLLEDNVDNEVVITWANSLDIDEIYYYNPEGKVLYSNQPHYIGWTSYPGHPVEDFRLSNQSMLIEDIRPDSDSGILNKYSYVRTPRGFFQLGIRAERVDMLLDAFEPNGLLVEMARQAQADSLFLLDSDLVVQYSSNPDFLGTRIAEPSLEKMLATRQPHVMVRGVSDDSVYQVYTPVYLGDVELGILGVTTSLAATQRIINQMTTIGIVLIAILFGSLAHAVYITYRRKKQLLEMAYHDSNSGLPNRRKLINAVLENETPGTALLLAHIQNFDDINHIYGFHFGHALFRTIAHRVEAAFGQLHQVFHVAGNRLVFYVPESRTQEELATLAHEIIEVMEAAIADQELRHQLPVEVAIVEMPDPNVEPEKIFTQASVALLHAGKSDAPYVFFTPDMEEQLLRSDVIERELRSLLGTPTSEHPRRLWVEYQPIVDLKTNQVVYFEALTRMHLPGLGRIPPPEFIEIAEGQQLAIQLGEWVLCESCNFLRQLQQQGFSHVYVSINISAADLLHSGFVERITRLVEQHKIPPHIINLEITESMMMYGFDAANAVLQDLRTRGFRIAIDDFGTGYSSFARLEDLNVDIIKIDKSFVDKILTAEPHRLVIGDLVRMCHRLGMEVVAEGVEEERQRLYLVEQGCDLMQGYLFSKPIEPTQALELLAAEECAGASS
ncbi:MAG: GGDEF domain-containing protein [Firmicutes bacterium]|nr:GGDEF domain-containing protein [Bacillota bacterium]